MATAEGAGGIESNRCPADTAGSSHRRAPTPSSAPGMFRDLLEKQVQEIN